MSFVEESLNFEGKTALVTGSSGLLGRVIAESLCELGCNIILVDLDGPVMKAESERLKKLYDVDVKYFETDLEKIEDRVSLIDKVHTQTSNLNFLINNAAFVGTSQLPGWNVDFESQSVETWRRALEVNLTANFEIIKGLYPLMKKSVGANIVNISSIYGFKAPVWKLYEGTSMGNPAAYAASKGGLIQMTRWLSTTLAPEVRVNCIAPGGIYSGQQRDFVTKYNEKVPLNRMANAEDVVGALVFLVSGLAKYVTGQVIVVDGGWSV